MDAWGNCFSGLRGRFCENAREERGVLLDYLSASGLVGCRRVGLIDVGWHGTMQRSITDMLRERGDCPDITGLYLGTYGFAHEIVLPDEKYPHDADLFRRGDPDDYRRLIWEGVEVVNCCFRRRRARSFVSSATPTENLFRSELPPI